MGGEIGQLQQLTDEQVKARLSAYNRDGSLERDLKLFRDQVLPAVVAEIGGQENAFTSYDYTAYYQQVPADALEMVMEYEADRMENLNHLLDELGQEDGNWDRAVARADEVKRSTTGDQRLMRLRSRDFH